MLHFAYAPFSMTSAVSFQVLFFVIPSACEESSMDASLRLRFAQHDKSDSVIPNAVRNPVWMLRFAQHDKSGKRGCLTSLSWIGL